MPKQAERHRKRHRRREAGARVDVGRERDGDAAVDQHARRREASELQVERRDRQQRRDDAGCRQAGGAGLVDEDQMIRRSRADLGGDGGSAARRRARRRGCAAASPAARPASRISRDSSGVNTPVSQNTSHHSASRSRATAGIISLHDQIDVRAAAIAVLDGHLVRAHEGRRQLDRVRRRERANSPQHLQLALGGERVAALGFAGRRAAAQHLVEAAARVGRQLLVRSPRASRRRVLTMPPPSAAISA